VLNELTRFERFTVFKPPALPEVFDFDALLADRYHPLVIEKLEHIENTLRRIKHLSAAGDIELKEQMLAAKAEFKRIEATLQSDIAVFENKLCHMGKEALIGKAKSALNSALPQLVGAAKVNNLNHVIAELLRPILQGQLTQLIQTELAALEFKIGQISTPDELNLNISIQIPAAEKDSFLNETVSIVSTVISLFFPQHRIGKLILTALSLLFGSRSKNEPDNQDALIEASICNEIIPQALNQAIAHIEIEITQAAAHLKQQFMQAFEHERMSYQTLISDLQSEQKEKQQKYQAQCQEYTAALNTLTELKATL